MMREAILVPLVAAAICAGCSAPSKPAGGAPQASAARSGLSGTASNATGAGRESGVAVPKDARWTIYCMTIGGPGHGAKAKEMRDQLVKNSGRRDWYVIQSQDQSTLYYGYYRSISDREDKQEAARAHADCTALREMNSPATGGKMFPMVSLMSLETEDPEAPTEWDLRRAKGAYTLQIGVYKDSPERKAYAVQAVREARQQGVEAYYYHGPTASHVCVGTWGPEALEVENEARATTPGSVPMVVPDTVAAPQGPIMLNGRPVEVVRPKVTIHDPTLREMMQRFPNNAVNGFESRMVKNPATGQKQRVTEPSLVVPIPRGERAMPPGPVAGGTGMGAPRIPAEVTAPPEVGGVSERPGTVPKVRPTLPASHGGRLKSIED